jgi:Ca2+-binding RTX toxin-like protein
MAVLKFGDALPQFTQLQDIYDDKSLKLKSHSAAELVYEDKNGDNITLTGSGIKTKGSAVTAGTIKSVAFDNADNGVLLSVTGGDYNAKSVSSTLAGDPSVFNLLSALTAGNDKIFSSNTVEDTMSVGTDHGNDTITFGKVGGFASGSEGNDTFKGGAGFDTVSYEDTYFFSDAKHGIVANLANGVVTDSWGGKDKLTGSIEELRGSIFNDKITGSAADESFMGLKGKDVIDGGAGENTARYDRDALYHGTSGIEARLDKGYIIDGFGDKDTVKNIQDVDGTAKNDAFVGDSANNKFHGLAGTDSYSGGSGVDAVSFFWSTNIGEHGVNVDMTKSTGQIIDDGFGNTETTKSIEAIAGSAFDDTIKLGSADGWAAGNSGDDTLVAGTGVQQFYGGTGKDTFVFNSAQAIGTEQGHRDYIADFSQADGDKIDFSGIGGLQFDGTGGFGGTPGEVHYLVQSGYTYVSGDVDGDKTADFTLVLKGEITLTADDFTM